jgi:type III secretory pathway component EscV/tetratricopeptide (TPR) repeat protein
MSETVDISKLIDLSVTAAADASAGKGIPDTLLDAIRAAHADGPGAFDLWTTIDGEIGKAKAPELQQQLIKLRTRFEEELLMAEVKRVEQAFHKEPDAGWKTLLVTLAEAITQFRLRFAGRLCEHACPFQETNRQSLENLSKAVRCMSQSRWPEAYDQLDFLAKQEFLPTGTKAKLLAMLGQIQLFHFQKTVAARELFDVAERLAPEDGKVLSAFGDYWIATKDIEKARSYFERAIRIAPGLANAYTGMGEYFESENKLGTAEEWYRKAITSAPGDGLGYSKLFKLFGHRELFTAHRHDLQPIMERAIAVYPEEEYQWYLDFGYVHEQNELFDEAQKWYEKAIAVDATRPAGYVAIAQSYEKQARTKEAEATYKKAIMVAPDYSDAYFGLTWLYEQQERWQDALEWYEKARRRNKQWAAIARVRVGEMQWRLRNYAEAEDTLKRELQADKNNEAAKTALQTLASTYYKERKDKQGAMRVQGEILEIVGESYGGDYHNSLGNMNYFYEDYTGAAREYLAAIAAKPGTAVFHRNLGKAYKELKEYTGAAREFGEALKLDKDTKNFNREMTLLLNAEGNDYYSQGDYRRAIEQYKKASECDPRDDVIYSNLAGALERLKERGGRVSALDEAIEALGRAQSVGGIEKYEGAITRLRQKREFAGRYGETSIDWLHVVTPLAMEVAADLIPFTEGSGSSLSDELSKNVTEMKARIQNDFGVRIPGVRFRGNETDLPAGTYIIMINEIPLVMGTINVDQRFYSGAAEALKSLGVKGLAATNPLTGGEGSWIEKPDWPKVESAGLELWSVSDYPIRHLEAVVQRNLADFVGHQEVANIIESESLETVAELRSSSAKLTALTTICKGLLEEGVSIKPFAQIYDAFERLYSEGVNVHDMVETIRSLPGLRSQLPGNDPRYRILPFGPRFEADLRNSIYKSGSHSLLAMEPENCQSALAAVRTEVGSKGNLAAVVDDAELRPFLRLLLELEFPNVPVLSRRELRTNVEFATVGLVELDGESVPLKQNFNNRNNAEVSSNGLAEDHQAILKPDEIAVAVSVNEAFVARRASADDKSIEETFSMMQDGLFYELGVVLPEIRLEIDNTLKANEFRFNLNGREYPAIPGLEPDEFLVNETVERLSKLGIEGKVTTNPANGNECAVVREEETPSKKCREAGLITWGPAGFLVLKLSAEIRKNAAEFQTLNATQYIIDSLRTVFPDLINTVMDRFSIEQICLVLRNLLEEDISIRDLRTILESLLSINGTTDVDQSRFIVFNSHVDGLCPVSDNRTVDDLTSADYSDFVRTDLKRYISHKYTRGHSTLIVYLLDPAIEKRLGNISTQPLTKDERASLRAAVKLEAGNLPATAQNPTLLTTMDVRRTLRKLIEPDLPNLAVLSYQELSPEMNIQPIARISWNLPAIAV